MTDDIKLPPPAQRIPYVGDVWTRDQVISVVKSDRQQRGEPVAFSYDLATTRSRDGEYTHWSPRLSYSMPNVPEGSIRNLQWLYATPQPAAPKFGEEE